MDAWRSALLSKVRAKRIELNEYITNFPATSRWNQLTDCLCFQFEFAFAAVLLVAAPNVYQTYGVWYEMHQGDLCITCYN